MFLSSLSTPFSIKPNVLFVWVGFFSFEGGCFGVGVFLLTTGHKEAHPEHTGMTTPTFLS